MVHSSRGSPGIFFFFWKGRVVSWFKKVEKQRSICVQALLSLFDCFFSLRITFLGISRRCLWFICKMFLFSVITECECGGVSIIAVTQFGLITILPSEYSITGMQLFSFSTANTTCLYVLPCCMALLAYAGRILRFSWVVQWSLRWVRYFTGLA